MVNTSLIRQPIKALQKIAVTGAIIGSIALAPTSSFAFDTRIAQGANHFATCFELMLTDPAAHAAECGPGRAPPAFTHVTGNGHYVYPVVDECKHHGKKHHRHHRRHRHHHQQMDS